MKDRNGMDLTEAEDIKKRWQQYTEELYKKDLHDPDNHEGVNTHLQPDILENQDKWTGSKLGKEYCEGCISSSCLFNLYAEYIMKNEC